MKILLDHCVPRRYIRLLREWGYDAELMSMHLAQDAPDPDVIALANKLDAVLLTVDLDFADIRNYTPANYNGIIVMRYQALNESSVDATLKTVLADLSREDLRGALVVLSPNRYRVRR